MSSAHLEKTPHILVVDDEAHLRELLEITLVKMGLDVTSAADLQEARDCLKKQHFSLILTDMRLPDGSGLDLVAEVNASEQPSPIAVITAFGSADNAVTALKAGAFDYVSKPVALDQLRKLVRAALQTNQLQPEPVQVAQLQNHPASSYLIGDSQAIQAVRNQIARLSRSMAPVMISGESGSGKELAAREIHRHSVRADKAFIAVNCGAIPENLMEAEFFGYRKGAFTGANEDREGFFQAANGGTLMLDEVADLPLAMQVKLLRAIQERRVRKIGATVEEAVDVRILSATHQNLSECVQRGKFREDLYYRLNVIELHLPPLRERLQDVVALSEAILQRLSKHSNAAFPVHLNAAALDALQHYEFPGNVRELENILERASAFANDGVIDVIDLGLRNLRVRTTNPEDAHALAASSLSGNADGMAGGFAMPSLPCSLPDFLDHVERSVILAALEKTANNRTAAAQLLGISFRQLRYQIQKLKIQDV
jgi:two-component system response regulator PilR (NtrC family)